jgi:hypothetical protein
MTIPSQYETPWLRVVTVVLATGGPIRWAEAVWVRRGLGRAGQTWARAGLGRAGMRISRGPVRPRAVGSR